MSQWTYKKGPKQSDVVSDAVMCRMIERGELSAASQIRELPKGPWVYVRDTHFAAIAVEPKPDYIRPISRPTTAVNSASGSHFFSQLRSAVTPWIILIAIGLVAFRWIGKGPTTKGEVDFDQFTQTLSEGIKRIGAANNDADKALIQDQYTKKMCTVTGGQITRWPGMLYDVSSSLTGGSVRVEIMLTASSLVTYIEKDTPLFNKVAAIKASTWTKAGERIVIDGYFDGNAFSGGCLAFRPSSLAYYPVTITDIH
jgi:hypothetical protein